MKVGDRVKLSHIGKLSCFPKNPARHGTILRVANRFAVIQWDDRKSPDKAPLICLEVVFQREIA